MSSPAIPATRTRLLRSRGMDHAATQEVLRKGLHELAYLAGHNPHDYEWTTEVIPFAIGVFNIGRAVALRSVGRAFAGEDDPGEYPDPMRGIEVEVDPGHDVRWRYAEEPPWTLNG